MTRPDPTSNSKMDNNIRYNVSISEETLDESAARLLEMLTDSLSHRTTPSRRDVEARLLKLGLLDEFLQIIAQTMPDVDSCANSLAHIERLIENRYFKTLDSVNPVLKKTTLELANRSLRDEDDKELSTHVITTVIYATAIFIMKLEPNTGMDIDTMNKSTSNLEVTFHYLAKFLEELTFSATDMLIRATNVLVVAIKSKLDTLADNELIRDSFKTLIEAVAGQCLIESQYKSAAMLYSQIEDNVSAVKALMRAGEAEVVIDFALLVRDINVDRITINFLKHLKVDIKIIEDFIARSRRDTRDR